MVVGVVLELTSLCNDLALLVSSWQALGTSRHPLFELSCFGNELIPFFLSWHVLEMKCHSLFKVGTS